MIRLFEQKDWPIVDAWWGDSEAKPIPEMLSETTYILEHQNRPAVTASLFLTNNPYGAWIENLVADPVLSPSIRHQLVDELFKFLEIEAKSRGYKAVVIFSYIDKLKDRYQSMGFVSTRTNITTFAKLI